MKRQEVQPTNKKAPNMYLSDNENTNLVFSVTVNPIDSNEGKIYSAICGCLPIISNKGNRYKTKITGIGSDQYQIE